MDKNNSTTQEQKDSAVDVQQPYVSSTDACTPLGTVVPASMAYEQKRFAEKLRSSIKPSVHEFVMNRLNYTDYREFCQSFGQEQIDAIANAIYNFENTGFGIIIADQTGVGKGRVGAGLIRYSIEHLKKMPIFVTDKKHLISDMYRDLIDINYQVNVPESVKLVSKEVEDLTDNQIIRLIKKDIDDNDDLRIDLEEIIDDVPDDFVKELDKLFSKEPSKAKLPNGFEEPEDLITVIIEAYRMYLELNGLETYQKDWVASFDGEFVINSKKGDTYDTLLKRELKEGRKLIKPFITFDYKVKDENGNILFTSKYNKKVEETQRLDRDLKVCMTTYSQFGTMLKDEQPTPKYNLIRKIALDSVLILDESHKATGVAKGEGTNTAKVVADLVQLSKDTIFISATFAKRPENMFLYAYKTAIRESNLSNQELLKVFKSGGNALQEATSAELARIGHIVRRQRPIVGETFYETESEASEIGKSQVDSFNVFRELNVSLRDYYSQVRTKYREYLKEYLGDDYKEQKDDYPHKGNITLLTFNLVNQFLLGLKVTQTSSNAISYLQDGKKPIIAIANTMESVFTNIKKDYINKISYEIGDIIVDDLSLIFPYLWDYCFKYKIYTEEKKLNKDGIVEDVRVGRDYHLIHDCSVDFLPLRAKLYSMYTAVLSSFNNANRIGTPLSPLDKIMHSIQSSGFKVGEVTGRKRKLVYDKNGNAILQTRKVANVTDTIRDFNFNIVDALILNRSGAVGVSMHAKPNSVVNKFDKAILKIENLDERPSPTSLEPRDEVKQRVMIITQMELDVNNEVQKLGRISRTGQIYAPIYKYLTSCVPFEERLASMMEMKLRSLMATVSSDQENAATLFTAEDYLSEEGGEIVQQPAESAGIGMPRNKSGEISLQGKELVDYCFKQLYFKSIKQQTEFFENFKIALYEEIAKRKREGTYNKKMVLKKYNAETFEVLPFELGMENPFSSFGAPVFAERVNIETFDIKNYDTVIEPTISKSLQSVEDSEGNKKNIESLQAYMSYMEKVADKNLNENVRVKYLQEVKDLEDKIQEAQDSIEERKLEIQGSEKLEEAESIFSRLSELSDKIEQNEKEGGKYLLSKNQDMIDKLSNEQQSYIDEQEQLTKRFENDFREIYENRENIYSEIRTIANLEKSQRNLSEKIKNWDEYINDQVQICERYKNYLYNIGSVYKVTTRQEEVNFSEDENGQTIEEYSYADTLQQNMVLVKVTYPFSARKDLKYTWGNVKLYFLPATGGMIEINLHNVEEPFVTIDLEKKKEHQTKIEYLGYRYDNKNKRWEELVDSSYSGTKGEKVFLTGSLLRAMSVANKNKLTGNIVKYNTIDKKVKIGYELSLAATNTILPKFNNTDSFPIVSQFSTKLVKDVVLPYIIRMLEDSQESNVITNFNNYEVLLFEVLEKIKAKIVKGVSTIDDTFFVEFKSNNQYTKSSAVQSLKDYSLDSQSLYVRFTSTSFLYIKTILDFLNVLNIENSMNITDGFARTLAFKTTKQDRQKGVGLKPFTVPPSLSSAKWDFKDVDNIPYYIEQYLKTKGNREGFGTYEFSTGFNAFVFSPILNNEIETKNIVDWYTPKFAIDLTLNDFCALCDYLKDLEMPIKTVVSYKMLKDSGTFDFDVESFQRASIITDINDEGNIEKTMSDELEKTIDGLIDNLVELFQ